MQNKIIITNENEKEYWVEYKKTSSPQIREALINRYAPLVKYEAFKIKSYLNMNIVYTYVIKNIIDFGDLVGFGFFGLLYAVERYNPNKDIKFKTYARLGIKGAIYDELRKMLPRIGYYDITEYILRFSTISLNEISRYIENKITPEYLLEKKEIKKEVIDALKKLPQIEYKVLKLYYYKELTLKEIVNIFEVSERRVSQIHGKAMQDLKDIFIKKEIFK